MPSDSERIERLELALTVALGALARLVRVVELEHEAELDAIDDALHLLANRPSTLVVAKATEPTAADYGAAVIPEGAIWVNTAGDEPTAPAVVRSGPARWGPSTYGEHK